jgi:hypothetical protein
LYHHESLENLSDRIEIPSDLARRRLVVFDVAREHENVWRSLLQVARSFSLPNSAGLIV